jgi:hypothetical protein
MFGFGHKCGTFVTGWRLAAFLDGWFGLWVAAILLNIWFFVTMWYYWLAVGSIS